MNALAERSLAIARGFIGVRELRRNRGPEVDMFTREGGGLNPEVPIAPPWCASFVSYCIITAMRETGGPWQFRPGASVIKLWSRNAHQLEARAPAPGTVFLRFDGDGKGHTGFVVELLADGRLRTIEGNTGPGPAVPAEDREGDGVYERFDRRPEDGWKWLAIG